MRARMLIAFAATCLLTSVATADHHEKEPAAHGHESGSEMPEMDAESHAMMEAWMKAGKPGEKHTEMAETAGVWTAEVKSWMGEGEPIITKGFADRSMILDGRVMQENFYGEFMGKPFAGVGLTGYDNVTGKYWSTWTDSMSTSMMVMQGEWNDEKGAIVWKGEMTNPMTGGKTPVKSMSRRGEGTETFEMWEPRGPEGEMVKSMEITYTR